MSQIQTNLYYVRLLLRAPLITYRADLLAYNTLHDKGTPLGTSAVRVFRRPLLGRLGRQ